MRARSRGVASVVAGLTLMAPAVEAQQPQATHFTIYGTVTDSLTGRPIADAAVGFKPAYKAVMTDSLGRFVIRGLESASQRVTVEQLGYEDQTLDIHASDPVLQVDVRLNPDPVVLKALPVIVRDYRRALKRMSVGKVYERRELMGMNLAELGSVLRQMGAIQVAIRPGMPGCSSDVVEVRGQRVCRRIIFDDQPLYGGGFGPGMINPLPGYPASEIYAVIVSPGGGQVRVITNWYIEYLARTGRRLMDM